MPRLFVAIDPDDEQSEQIATLHDPELNARWTRSEQHHLTLRFVGETDEETAERLAEHLARVRAPAFELEAYSGLDAFPSRRRPRVLIVRLALSPPLASLQQQVEDAVVQTGFETEARSFKPHLTVARLKRASAKEVRRYLQRHQGFELAPFRADAFHLYQSELHPSGARYQKLRSYPLRY